jgi:hypothetical protein
MLSNDTGNHLPPSGGAYDYNTFTPGSGGFPTNGQSYLDPIFGGVNPQGSTVQKFRAQTGTNPGQDIYGHHWINADGSYFFWSDASLGRCVCKVSDGSVVRSGVSWTSTTGDVSWHPTNPDKYFYFNGSDIRVYTVSSGTSTTVNPIPFPSALQSCGGSLDFVDATGTKFSIQYGGAGHVYDSTSNTTYTGATAGAPGTGYWCMAANANYAFLVTGGSFLAFPLDNVNHIVGASFPFWTDSGDHAGFASASDGSVRMARAENVTDGQLYIIKVKDQTGKTLAQIKADPDNYIGISWLWIYDQHISGVGRGTFQDWIFLNTEWPTDVFNYNPATAWHPYAQEIMAINVLTKEVRRFAHHRSRSIGAAYDYQPHVSCAWDGSAIMWNSNFNSSAASEPDAWGILNPLGTSSSATPIGGFKSL